MGKNFVSIWEREIMAGGNKIRGKYKTGGKYKIISYWKYDRFEEVLENYHQRTFHVSKKQTSIIDFLKKKNNQKIILTPSYLHMSTIYTTTINPNIMARKLQNFLNELMLYTYRLTGLFKINYNKTRLFM